MSLVRHLGRAVVHGITQGRRRTQRWLTRQVADVRHADVLEIGSGKPVNGSYPYSFSSLFDSSCTVTMTDLDPAFGHDVVDVTAMTFDQEFDVVVCANVLEHLREPQLAVDAIARALRPGGIALVTVPMMYPLHDEPSDYWRITEHGLRHLFADYQQVQIAHSGARIAPFGYMLRAYRG